MIGPWKRARLEHARAEANRRACDENAAENRRLTKENEALTRMVGQYEDTIRQLQYLTRDRDVTRLTVELVLAKDIRKALEARLADAQRAQEVCDRDHAPLVRAWQLRAVDGARAAGLDPWDGLPDGWAVIDAQHDDEETG